MICRMKRFQVSILPILCLSVDVEAIYTQPRERATRYLPFIAESTETPQNRVPHTYCGDSKHISPLQTNRSLSGILFWQIIILAAPFSIALGPAWYLLHL
jgi:hypothetical protein